LRIADQLELGFGGSLGQEVIHTGLGGDGPRRSAVIRPVIMIVFKCPSYATGRSVPLMPPLTISLDRSHPGLRNCAQPPGAYHQRGDSFDCGVSNPRGTSLPFCWIRVDHPNPGAFADGLSIEVHAPTCASGRERDEMHPWGAASVAARVWPATHISLWPAQRCERPSGVSSDREG